MTGTGHVPQILVRGSWLCPGIPTFTLASFLFIPPPRSFFFFSNLSAKEGRWRLQSHKKVNVYARTAPFFAAFLQTKYEKLQRYHSGKSVSACTGLPFPRLISYVGIRMSHGEKILKRAWHVCPSNFQEYMSIQMWACVSFLEL